MPSSSADLTQRATGLQVRPFRALTYRRRDPEHLAGVSSPAYDLVTPGGRARLAAADPHNVVRLILPDAAAGAGSGGAEPVERAAARLREWRGAGVLELDPAPALWAYEMSPPGAAAATVGWLAAVGLPPAGSRAVLPHEDTFPAAVEGRRALLAATATDLEPIVLAHDPSPAVAGLTAAVVTGGAPTLHLTDTAGVSHRLWRVSDQRVLSPLVRAFTGVDAVIADGHHRFAAAREHARTAAGGRPPAILSLLTPMGPGGLRVHAIHRVVPDLPFDRAVDAAARGFRTRGLPIGAGTVLEGAGRWLTDPACAALLLSDGDRLVRLDGAAPAVLAAVPEGAPPAWRGLDVVLAHHGLLRHLWGRGEQPEDVLVAHDLDQALGDAVARRGVAVLLRAPSPADVAAVAREGARMPRKSTLFVPKPRTGLVMRPHAA